MSTLRLNAVTVRSNDLPVKPPGRSSLDEALSQPLLMTRRQLLAAAGTAVAVGAISTRTLEPLLETESGTHARGAWLRAGAYRATVDPSLFGGNPRLNVSRNGSWYAELRDALFPGTSLPAGVELAVLGSGALARLRIRHDLGGFLAEVPLSGWLSGETPAKADVRLGELTQPLGDGHTLKLAGVATATLLPDWSLRLEGRDIARLSGLGREIVADAVTIALAAESAPTLLSRRVARRTLITLEGDAKTWEIDAPSLSGGRSMAIAAGALDRVTVEAAEARSGAVHRALVAFSTNGGAATFAPNTGMAGDADTLSLGSLRYARLLDGSGGYHLAADFAEPAWAQAYGHTLLIGGASWTRPFEVIGGAAGSTVSAEPAVRGLAAPFQGAIASPITFPEDARSTVRLGDAPRGMGAAAAPIAAPIADIPFIPFPIPQQSYFTVTRPDDMLSLRFELYNLEFVSQSGGPSLLVRSSTREQSYLSVVFPGQHVLERAWMIQQTPGTAPYQAYLADETQLAFKVPSAIADKGIPFTMEGLLDWSQFTHNVVDAAKSPARAADMKRYMRIPFSGSNTLGINPETYLEIPWGLYLSPEPDAFWTHRTQPLTSRSRTELWYTKLHGAYSSLPIFVVSGDETPKPDAQGNEKLKSAALPTPGDVVIGPVDPGGFRPRFETPPTLRAVWSRHYDIRLTSDNPIPDAPTVGLFRNSFTTNQQDTDTVPVYIPTFPFIKFVKNDIGGIKQRWSITDLSGRYHRDPINVNHLLLTSLGAWMDSKAKWATDVIATEPGVSISTELLQWDHRMTMGRDQYVKIVLFGRLFPFGHKAVKVIITERKVRADSPFAFLEQRTYLMVREPTVTYSNDSAPINRSIPYKSVTLKTLQTPPVLEGTVTGVALTEDAFWPREVASGQDIQWQVEAVDWDGNAKKFTMPLIYVRGFVAGKYDNIVNFSAAQPILTACSNAMKLRQVDFGGQTVAYAKNVAGTNKDQARVLPTNWQRFEAGVYDPDAAGDARFHPKLYRANVSLDALEEMTNQKAGTTIEIADQYKSLGFGGANAAGRVFAKIVTPPTVGFPAELAGALATPVPLFSGISANKGTFGGDLAQFGSGQYSPAGFFDALNANLIGGITLLDVLEAVLGLDKMPVFEKVRDALDSDMLIVQFTWETPVQSITTGPLKGLFIAGSGAKLKLHAEMRKKLSDATAPPTSLVRGELGPFTLQLVEPVFKAINLTFSTFTFESVDGASPSVNPVISDVEFVGVLKYLSTLAKYLGSLGGVGGSSMALAKPAGPHALVSVVDSGPLKIDVTGAGITASLSLQLPDVTVGVFSLKNMSFFAGLTLPFSGDPVTLDFAFCSRESPFELLVMGFGGGGYVLMQLDINGMRMLEISLEFGAGTSLDIGVASGSVEIKGGFTLRYERDVGLTFTMFIRIRGSLSVLGLITVTITFYLELEYRTFTCPGGADGDELTGTATLTIEIEILFFSFGVELSVTKTLAGSDPRFFDLMPVKTDWDDYCAAFAPARLGA